MALPRSAPADKGEGEQTTGKQEAIDQAVVAPVEPIALIEASVKQSEPKPE